MNDYSGLSMSFFYYLQRFFEQGVITDCKCPQPENLEVFTNNV